MCKIIDYIPNSQIYKNKSSSFLIFLSLSLFYIAVNQLLHCIMMYKSVIANYGTITSIFMVLFHFVWRNGYDLTYYTSLLLR